MGEGDRIAFASNRRVLGSLCGERPTVGEVPMIPRALALLIGLAAIALLAGCGEDEATTTVTETTTAESEALPTGPAVAQLQQVMTELGYYSGPIDGVYGEETTAAVEEMQTDLGVTADGIYGEETHAALQDKASSITIEIQTVLSEYGYYTGEIDGTYGPETVAAVQALQTDLGVTADGRFGPETADAFNEAVASGELEPA
jgi:peptidoglycan hydrolase-like protein with peptidoglycan-binding domain